MTIQEKEARAFEARGKVMQARSNMSTAKLEYTDALVDLLTDTAEALSVRVQQALCHTRDIPDKGVTDPNQDRAGALALLEEIDQKLGAYKMKVARLRRPQTNHEDPNAD